MSENCTPNEVLLQAICPTFMRKQKALSFLQIADGSHADGAGRGDTSFASQPAAGSKNRSSAGSKNKGSGGSEKKDMRQTPRLERNVQIRLQFQSPEIYNTDIGAERRGQGRIHGCKFPDADGKGEAAMLHPEIAFNALPPIFGGKRGVHVHLEDLTDHKVFWDADFKLPMFDPIMNIVGKTRIKKYAAPMNMADQFHKPCVPKDDMRPHFFDLSVRTLGKYWDDIVEEWRPNKGFKDNGPEAHIGFLVQRMPELSADGKEEMLGVWKRKGSPIAAEGDVIQDPFERALAGHEDPFYNKTKGTTQRGYYDHIINIWGRFKDRLGYVAKFGPQLLLGLPPELEDDDNGEPNQGLPNTAR